MAVRSTSPSWNPLEADAPAESHVAAAQPGDEIVDAHAAGVERDAAVDRLQPVRQPEMPDPAVRDRGASAEHRLVERSLHLGDDLGGAGAADIPEKALEQAEVRVARRAQRDLAVVQPDLAANVELGALACEAQTADTDGVAIERELDRSVVANGIVEKLQIEGVHRRVDEKMVDVGELPGDTDRTAHDGVRVRRQLWNEEPDVRVERAVDEPERQLGVRFRRERDPA